ncbi:LOW QUALITY PROTEIN: hypothetical protein QTO34_018941 [Cnephaeus nilssonii]|uniref:Fibronectin type-III domain-containing protein n=1 Tax=Cnephaeus nilssonii TaxID=3371016 RepID=A0AA40HZQ7_CNENI|nr:LOW QUALITY PROTEIN: hypothetical protein QTO34_018941 [Eptesicus nilssonii]
MRTLLTILAAGSLAAHIAEDTSDLLQRVTFQSSNFENILTWDSGLESAPDTVYSVEYKTYGEVEWLAKKGCQRITRKFCNLTMETGSLTELYYARVTATGAGGRSATKMTERFSSLQHTTIKPPDVTCIPAIHPDDYPSHPTPLRDRDGHRLTLEDIFHDLFYRLDLHINQTYQMNLGGKQREYEFIGLTPDTEFLGTITIIVPTWSKESAPYIPDMDLLLLGAFLFSMGFLVAGLCYLSYRYVTKPPQPPNSLDVQRVLTFQPLRFIQEHVLIPVLDLSGPGGLAQPTQYSQVMVSAPREPPGAPRRHSRLRSPTSGSRTSPPCSPPGRRLPRHRLPRQAPRHPTRPRLPRRSGPQPTRLKSHPEAKAPSYTPQAVSSYTPQAAPDSWPPSYGVCMGGSDKDSPPGTFSSPKPLRTKGQKEPPAADLSLQGLASGAMEEPQEAKSFPQRLCVDTDRAPGTTVLPKGEPGTPGYLKGQLPLLASVRIEGHPVSLPLHTPSLPCCPTDQGSRPGGLLESLVCPKDDGPGSEPEASSVAPGPQPRSSPRSWTPSSEAWP